MNHKMEKKIIWRLIYNKAISGLSWMDTGSLRKEAYGRRSSSGFWKFIDRLEEKGFITMEPNKIVLTPKGEESHYKDARSDLEQCSCCGKKTAELYCIRREWKKAGLKFCRNCVVTGQAKQFALKNETGVSTHG